jgi:hypothetical protein
MIALTAFVLAVAPSFNVELELGGGLAHSLESSLDVNGGYALATPALQSRLAVDYSDLLSLGATFLAVMGGEAVNRASAWPGNVGGNRAFKATALLFSLRVHSSGSPQFWAEGGLGVGQLISLQTDKTLEHAPLRGHAGLATRLATGLRWALGERFLLGGELGLTRWSNVESGPTGCCGYSLSGLDTWAATLLFSVTYSVFAR